jgi:hypothetical protein
MLEMLRTVFDNPPALDVFRREVLDSHNRYRGRYGLNPLRLNNEVGSFYKRRGSDKKAF